MGELHRASGNDFDSIVFHVHLGGLLCVVCLGHEGGGV